MRILSVNNILEESPQRKITRYMVSDIVLIDDFMV